MDLNTMLEELLNEGWEVLLRLGPLHGGGTEQFVALVTDGRDWDNGALEGSGETPQDAVADLIAVLIREHPGD